MTAGSDTNSSGAKLTPCRTASTATRRPSRLTRTSTQNVRPRCDGGVMSTTVTETTPEVSPKERLAVLFDELAELTGQRNAIGGRIVDVVAEIDRHGLWGATGARSVAALVAWKTGTSRANAAAVAAVAHRVGEFPRCTGGLREGRLSLDQIAVIASRGGEGSDAHYAQLASVATVSQLRTAVSLEPRPDPDPRPDPVASISKSGGENGFDLWRIRLAHAESAMFEAALAAHRDALFAEWKHDRENTPGGPCKNHPPMPSTLDAFQRLVETGWDGEAGRRPHGQRTDSITSAASPSPVPPRACASPTTTARNCTPDHWPDLRADRRRTSHHAPAPSANAPTGGGTTPTSRQTRRASIRRSLGPCSALPNPCGSAGLSRRGLGGSDRKRHAHRQIQRRTRHPQMYRRIP
ncbi:MAG: hypothetical protein QG655_1725 [Actinomycetota bacterium]|nr:hypothetical protein [Actinomycetota bacterium]